MSQSNNRCSERSCDVRPCDVVSTAGLRVRSQIRGGTLLQWDLQSVPEIRNWPGPIEVAIEYSHVGMDSPSWIPLVGSARVGQQVTSTWQQLSDYQERDDFYEVSGQLLYSHDFNLHYRLRLRNPLGDILLTRPVSMFSDLPGRQRTLYLELLRRWKNRARAGELQVGRLLKRRRWGGYCLTCRDRDGGQQIQSQCLECYDTGFTGGYFRGDSCYYVEPAPTTTDVAFDFGKGFNQTGPVSSFYVLNQPEIYPGDIWVDLVTDERWLFGSPMTTKIRTGNVELFRAIPTIRLDATHIIYRFPVHG